MSFYQRVIWRKVICFECYMKHYPETKAASTLLLTYSSRGGRVVRWSWINFQVRGVLLVWIRVGQGPTALAVGAGGGCLDIFTLLYPFSFLSPSLWETTRYRLKYCLKGSLSPKTTNQPTTYSSNWLLVELFKTCLIIKQFRFYIPKTVFHS